MLHDGLGGGRTIKDVARLCGAGHRVELGPTSSEQVRSGQLLGAAGSLLIYAPRRTGSS
jgi:hypothetical protein